MKMMWPEMISGKLSMVAVVVVLVSSESPAEDWSCLCCKKFFMGEMVFSGVRFTCVFLCG
jgi:hypothetical protein